MTADELRKLADRGPFYVGTLVPALRRAADALEHAHAERMRLDALRAELALQRDEARDALQSERQAFRTQLREILADTQVSDPAHRDLVERLGALLGSLPPF